ncbi:MAG: hypothetical protein JW986_09460 [Methanotrichaceae archaeon]|nr:hypothetical protein [Methanotrichaceae archaeon]
MKEEAVRISGQKPSAEDMRWIEYGWETLRDSPKILDEAARSLVTLGSSLLTVYTLVLTLFNLSGRLDLSAGYRMLLLVPILAWLASISLAAYVYYPKEIKYSRFSPSDLEERHKDVMKGKGRLLKLAALTFVIALASSSACIVWLGTSPPQESLQQTVTLIVKGDICPNQTLTDITNGTCLISGDLVPNTRPPEEEI